MSLSKAAKKRLKAMSKAGRPRWGSGYSCRTVPSKRKVGPTRASTQELLWCAEEA